MSTSHIPAHFGRPGARRELRSGRVGTVAWHVVVDSRPQRATGAALRASARPKRTVAIVAERRRATHAALTSVPKTKRLDLIEPARLRSGPDRASGRRC